jgi:HSP20 family protein
VGDPPIFPDSRIVDDAPLVVEHPGDTMTKLAVQRQSRPLIPELSEIFSGFPAFPNYPALAGLRPFFDSHLMRVEDEMTDDRYEVRAELPGVDPADIDITVRNGQLSIKAERAEKKATNGRSEFLYGAFTRTVPLPVGAQEDGITASYGKGILTISIPVSTDAPVEKHVEVQSTETDVPVASNTN